jgi:hypothetical protein
MPRELLAMQVGRAPIRFALPDRENTTQLSESERLARLLDNQPQSSIEP